MRMYFVSGANGVGKSTIIPYLQNSLPKESYEVHDFDERGVPEDADKNWRISEAKNWINIGRNLFSNGKVLVVCGFVKIEDFNDDHDLLGTDVVLILLDAPEEVVRSRVSARYTLNDVLDESQTVIGLPIMKFIQNSMYISKLLRDSWQSNGYPIVHTNGLNPEEVAAKVKELIEAKY